jgi:hypothetical protein
MPQFAANAQSRLMRRTVSADAARYSRGMDALSEIPHLHAHTQIQKSLSTKCWGFFIGWNLGTEPATKQRAELVEMGDLNPRPEIKR